MNATTVEKGVAGRINYAAWDKLASQLVDEVDLEEQAEIEEQKAKLGLDGKYARSAAEAVEREKASKVAETKKTLDNFKQRETAVIQSFQNVFGESIDAVSTNEDMSQQKKKNNKKDCWRITRQDLEAGKRVVSISDSTGVTPLESKIFLTTDLSNIESKMPINTKAKKFSDDAENDVVTPDPTTNVRSIYGLIKVFLSNLQNCTVVCQCKVITGTIELHNCKNVVVRIESEATVATIQADLSQDIVIEFHDAASGRQEGPKKQYWGDDKDDRIFHAGITNMLVKIVRDGITDSELVCDYLKDGAVTVGNATPEEFQFVTSCLDGTLVTEQVVRAGSATGQNVRAMTNRELQAEKDMRERAAKMAVKMADDMIQIKDKDGNALVKKTNLVAPSDDAVVEEVFSQEIKQVLDECIQLKARGNEAFGAGEYGQSILHYSLCLDKAAELSDVSQFDCDIIYANRSAAFLKLGQHEKAESDANEALRINPDNLKAQFRKGLALHASGDYFEALPVLAKAHKLEPKNKQIKQALQFCEVRVQQEHRKRMEQ